ncbi:hypothetical protein [Kitasatospora sp. NPDC087314]|uniref:hypothetical protein n=1 Tax=Kitasatospora sp. NPDC087314 TaxID=3364068 RepID=UPI00381154E3
MSLWQAALLGAMGGAFAGLIDFYQRANQWASAFAEEAAKRRRRPVAPPRLWGGTFYNRADLTVAGLEVLLGGLAGVLLAGSGQISGPYATVIVGASAPTLLVRLFNGSPLGGTQPGSEPPPAVETGVLAFPPPARGPVQSGEPISDLPTRPNGDAHGH